MTLGKVHLMATVPMFVAAIGYNIWYFAQEDAANGTRPAQNAVAPVAATGPSVASGGPPPVDPLQIPPAPDVALDTLPQWTRNPFADLRAPAIAASDTPVTADPAQPPPDADLVVAMILSGPDRRLARVNGQTVRVGDRVGTSLVVDILPDAIVVESPSQGRRTIAAGRRKAPSAVGGRP